MLLAFGAPVLLLYFAFIASLAALDAPAHSIYFKAASVILSALFYFAQFLAAWYLTRTFFPSSSSKLTAILKYMGMFVGCLFCSLCGAIACQAFGYALYLRVMRRGM